MALYNKAIGKLQMDSLDINGFVISVSAIVVVLSI